MTRIFINTPRPTIEEIAAMVGLKPKELAEVRRVAREVLEKGRRNGKTSKHPKRRRQAKAGRAQLKRS